MDATDDAAAMYLFLGHLADARYKRRIHLFAGRGPRPQFFSVGGLTFELKTRLQRLGDKALAEFLRSYDSFSKKAVIVVSSEQQEVVTTA
jgi:hypothetical protein